MAVIRCTSHSLRQPAPNLRSRVLADGRQFHLLRLLLRFFNVLQRGVCFALFRLLRQSDVGCFNEGPKKSPLLWLMNPGIDLAVAINCGLTVWHLRYVAPRIGCDTLQLKTQVGYE